MDIDKIEAGLELDALVAEKVMGWDVNFTAPDIRGGQVHWRDPIHKTLYLPGQWCPSSDIAAAWEVVENLIARESRNDGGFWYVRLELEAQRSTINGRERIDQSWSCKITAWVGGHFDSEADTAPLAICRAALKAITGGKI